MITTIQKELSKSATADSRGGRSSQTVDDRCSETNMTDGERRKGRMLDDFYPSAMKGR